jgi:YfiH family protein
MAFIRLFENISGVQAVITTVGFNACHYAGAEPQQVAHDRAVLAEYFGVPDNGIYIPVQTHSTNVAMPGDNLEGVDAMVANRPGQVIAINTADCLPLLLADVKAGIIAAVHCGWRGTVAGIATNAVRKMIELGAKPENIAAAMGACIGTECFEVGEEVASQFAEAAVVRTYAKPHVDLAKAVTMQLTGMGISADNIATPIACSMCDTRFHSVRREGRALPFRTLTAIVLT